MEGHATVHQTCAWSSLIERFFEACREVDMKQNSPRFNGRSIQIFGWLHQVGWISQQLCLSDRVGKVIQVIFRTQTINLFSSHFWKENSLKSGHFPLQVFQKKIFFIFTNPAFCGEVFNSPHEFHKSEFHIFCSKQTMNHNWNRYLPG